MTTMRRILVALLLTTLLALALVAAPKAQLTLVGVGPGNASSGGTCAYPLTGLTAAPVAAYALRPLSSSYAGNLFTLTRTSDSTTQTFAVGTGCASQSTASFCAATTCLISTLYDQSGNGNNLVQTTQSQMPTYTASGQNGQPVMTFSQASSQFLGSQAGSTIPAPEETTNFSEYYTGGITGGASGYTFTMCHGRGGNNGGWCVAAQEGGSNVFSFSGGNGSAIPWATSSLSDLDGVWRTYMTTTTQTGPSTIFYGGGNTAQGTVVAGPNTSAPNATDFNVGGSNGNDLFSTGSYGEFVYFVSNTTSPLSSGDRGTIFSADSAYWGAN